MSQTLGNSASGSDSSVVLDGYTQQGEATRFLRNSVVGLVAGIVGAGVAQYHNLGVGGVAISAATGAGAGMLILKVQESIEAWWDRFTREGW